MKLNTFIKLLIAFAAGLVICGIGAGVCVMEITSLEIVRASEQTKITEKDYTLPKGEKLYIDGWCRNMEVVKDEAVPKGTIKIAAEYSEGTELTFHDIENMYLCEEKVGSHEKEYYYDNDDPDFDDDLGLDEDVYRYIEEDDEDIDVIRHDVKGLYIPDYSFTDDDEWNEFQKMLEYLKNKQVYVPSDRISGVKIYCNPADSGKITCLCKKDGNRAWLENGSVYDETYEEETPAEPNTEPAAVTLTTAVPLSNVKINIK